MLLFILRKDWCFLEHGTDPLPKAAGLPFSKSFKPVLITISTAAKLIHLGSVKKTPTSLGKVSILRSKEVRGCVDAQQTAVLHRW
uniref:Uncharacterized protein n=1 Tax=Sphaerodactylus townsendi TaxID=933632 RepID=A0ACB8FJX1_9SAUR